jgi:tryptophan halogenase
MARRNRFAPPATDPSSPLSTYSYAYQFDAGLYARYLREYAEARGVTRTEGRIREIELQQESGFAEAVILDDGRRIAADFFIDCSGFRGLVIEQAMQAGYDDWSHWLPCDRAIALPSASTDEFPPYTRATALEAGWAWRIPLQHRVGNGHVYASAFMDDSRAEALLREQLEGEPLAQPNRLRFLAGKRRQQWVRNCVSIGLSSGFLEPLESTSIHLIQVAIGNLLDLFPTGAWDPADTAEFNRIMDVEYVRVRDFLILHYKATSRTDTEFWAYCRNMDIPDSLASKIELFRERGIVAAYEHGVFLEPSWVAVMIGQGILPERTDPRCLAYPDDRALAAMAGLRSDLAARAESMPRHTAALDLDAAAAAAAV